MRIGLFTEGTYPVVTGGVSTWCEHLIHGMPEHQFVPVTVVGDDERPLGNLPANVSEVTLVPMWGTPKVLLPLVHTGAAGRLIDIQDALWSAVLPVEGDEDLGEFGRALRLLTEWRGPSLSGLLARHHSTKWILQAWARHRIGRPDLPDMTLADAAAAAEMGDRVLALADRSWPHVDISHVASIGPPSVLALGRWWRDGTPIVVTEHGIYLRERLIALAGAEKTSWVSRYVIGAFLRSLTRLTYAEAYMVAPVSNFNRRWEMELGTAPGKAKTVYNGVEFEKYNKLGPEPTVPTVSFVGRIDPLKYLELLIDAFAIVHRAMPQARLRLFGPTPRGNESYHAQLQRQIDGLGLGDAVTFEGRVEGSQPAIEAGNVVALSSISEGLPYTVIEAMMGGRATVNTDVGGVGEIVGTDGRAGLLVPPRDAEAFGRALLELLGDPARRTAMGLAAQQRAADLFSMQKFVGNYRALYSAALAARPVPPSDEGRSRSRRRRSETAPSVAAGDRPQAAGMER